MTLNLFAPPTTNWLTEAPRRAFETRGAYEAAIRDTRSDALGAARSMAGTGSGAAGSRAALQAVAPAVADLRRQQVIASEAEGRRIRAEMLAEQQRSSDFMNNLFGGLAGIAGQTMVPLIGGLGSGGTPNGGASPGPAMTSAPRPVAPAAAASPAAPAATPAPVSTAAPTAAGPVDPFSDFEERRRRASLGSLFGAAAPAVGMANPLAGLGVGMAGRLFG